jgi:hypothetical protein
MKEFALTFCRTRTLPSYTRTFEEFAEPTWRGRNHGKAIRKTPMVSHRYFQIEIGKQSTRMLRR